MPRPVRFTLTLVVAALAVLAYASVAYAQDPAAEPTEPAAERPAAETAPPAEDGSLATGDNAADADEANDELELPAGENDSEAAQDDTAAEDTDEDDGSGDTAQADDQDRSCDDFDSQEEAQQYFTDQGGDATHNVDDLDADGDGTACESLNAPAGGIDAGGGGTAPSPGSSSDDGPLPFLLGGGALGLMLGAFSLLLARRRRAGV